MWHPLHGCSSSMSLHHLPMGRVLSSITCTQSSWVVADRAMLTLATASSASESQSASLDAFIASRMASSLISRTCERPLLDCMQLTTKVWPSGPEGSGRRKVIALSHFLAFTMSLIFKVNGFTLEPVLFRPTCLKGPAESIADIAWCWLRLSNLMDR